MDTVQDIRQSDQWGTYMECIGWKVERIGGTLVYIRKLGMAGSIIKITKSPLNISLPDIDTLAKKYRALFVKMEPDSLYEKSDMALLKKAGYSEDNWSFSPTTTIRIDLKQSSQSLLAHIQKDTRYGIRRAQKEQLTLVVGTGLKDLETFLDLYKQTAHDKHFWIGPIDQLYARWHVFVDSGKAELLLVYHKDRLVAGAIMLYHGKTAYYYHAAGSVEGYKVSAPSFLIWEIIQRSKKEGFEILDFEGIRDTRIPSTKSWEGFSQFKKTFGGKELVFLGSFTKYYNPLLGITFRLLQKLGL